MSKDIIRSNYDRFYLKTSMFVFFSVFFVILITLSMFNISRLSYGYLRDLAIVIVFYTTLLSVVGGLYAQNHMRDKKVNKFRYLISSIVGSAFGFVMIILMFAYLFFVSNMINLSNIAPIEASFIVSLFSVFAVYLSMKFVYDFDQSRYLYLTVITYVVGFCSSVILTQNKDWWYTSVCALGMPSNSNFEYYNITLILGGLMLMAFAYYLWPQFKLLIKKRLLGRLQFIVLAFLYYTQALIIALVGVFPYGISDYTNGIHMFLAKSTLYVIAAMMVFAFWFFNKFPKNFLKMNYLLTFCGVILYYVSNYTITELFTLAEVLNIFVVISWVGLFLKNIRKLSGAEVTLL